MPPSQITDTGAARAPASSRKRRRGAAPVIPIDSENTNDDEDDGWGHLDYQPSKFAPDQPLKQTSPRLPQSVMRNDTKSARTHRHIMPAPYDIKANSSSFPLPTALGPPRLAPMSTIQARHLEKARLAAITVATSNRQSRANAMQTASPIINTVTTPAMEIGSSTGIFDPGNVEDGKPTTSLARFSTSTRLAELKYNNSARTEAMEFHMREYEKLQKDRDILEIAARDFEAMEKQATRILHSLGELG